MLVESHTIIMPVRKSVPIRRCLSTLWIGRVLAFIGDENRGYIERGPLQDQGLFWLPAVLGARFHEHGVTAKT